MMDIGAKVNDIALTAGEGDAVDLLEVGEEFDLAPFGEEGGDGVALAVADFEGQQAVGPQQLPRLRDESAVDVEAGGAGEESLRWFVVADLWVQVGRVGRWDVGWVRDDRVVGWFVQEGREQVGFDEADAVGERVVSRVFPSDCVGFR